MSITTKTGDGGQTSLYSGQRLWKDDLRVEAYGTIDELDAHVGDACHQIEDTGIIAILRRIQDLLYRVMGELATVDQQYAYPICASEVDYVTDLIHGFEQKTQLKAFVVPGALPASAKLDLCRTVARRAERRLIALRRSAPVPAPVMELVNRLSDLFFIIARHLEDEANSIIYKNKPEHSGCKGE